ncbi:MAG TPA: carboxynorspermidine decarboxylase [Sphingorhabdus sp.]|jgi:carboxynorspermidine decarboxylase|uniref:carboxynorspermidine decarboxylase n=1 Tax=Sphingorhabdus sp. TaxID=1902408 RepID=UPI002CB92DC5|nr:carboxynorspermidine decarboxylase [Sphingorhabdus sp.]HMT41325.1 carboxynorspermidine decarboxylase [Sphingorhabdus sp.]HMU22660.1 carboxynorspermidine decarboxylase [Sphingorhabdus sp.]
METRAGDPGAFARFDLNRVPTPAFVVDEIAVRRNLAVLAEVKARSGAKVLSALKAFSMWSLADVVGEYLDGVCTSGLWEARLARDHYKGEIATYCAGYKAADMAEIVAISDHIIFNSPAQHRRFAAYIDDSVDVGLRINPEHAEGEVAKYDPCSPHSRLGFPVSQLRPEHLQGVSGIHFHSLCEQDFLPLKRTWESLKPKIAPYFSQLKWLNFGGGHHITRADYQRDDLVEFIKAVRAETGCDVYLEPGEAIALDAGILVGELLDVFDNGMPIGITDISATCHMPDVIEAPYRPAMLGERSEGPAIRLGGPSCLAGDIIGDYGLPVAMEAGQRFAFLDQAHYSMVKTNTFNGVPLPSIWLWNSDSDELRCVREFDWTEFRDRLS